VNAIEVGEATSDVTAAVGLGLGDAGADDVVAVAVGSGPWRMSTTVPLLHADADATAIAAKITA
jgi:hypothetical protein